MENIVIWLFGDDIVWVSAGYGYLLPVVIGAIILAGYWLFQKYSILAILGFKTRRSVLFRNFSFSKQLMYWICIGISVCMLWIALLRPQWGQEEEKIIARGRDLVVVLDISRSMLAQDLKPDRLTRAKEKIKQLMQLLPSERLGLILFGNSAFVYCPLTADHSAFLTLLDTVDGQMISSGTTAIDQALQKVIDMYTGMQNDNRNKLVVLCTDGEDFSSNLTTIKKQAVQEGLIIFTIGIGTPDGAPIPMYDEEGKIQGHLKDDKGTIVITRLNEGILQSIAHESGGFYQTITPDEQDIKHIQAIVQTYEKKLYDEKRTTRKQERFTYFAGIAGLFLLVAWIL